MPEVRYAVIQYGANADLRLGTYLTRASAEARIAELLANDDDAMYGVRTEKAPDQEVYRVIVKTNGERVPGEIVYTAREQAESAARGWTQIGTFDEVSVQVGRVSWADATAPVGGES